MNTKIAAAVAIVVVIVVVAVSARGCSALCASIEQLERNPREYLGKELCVDGRVSTRVDWPGTRHDYYKLSQDNGAVWVHGGSPPPQGVRVQVQGQFVRGKDCYSPLVDYVVCERERKTE